MSNLRAESLFEQLVNLTDPRRDHLKFHSLFDIFVIALCAVICGAEHWTEIEQFGYFKRAWLASFLELRNGIPSHDTFRRVFSLLATAELQEIFSEWVSSSINLKKGMRINIDGKQLRGSREAVSGKKALNVVSAWVSEASVVIGQVKGEEKSNEITAIPELLKMLKIEGCYVTIDAMGCQTEIVRQIADKKADYVISLKGNQGNLHKEVKEYLDWAERIKFGGIEYDYSKYTTVNE